MTRPRDRKRLRQRGQSTAEYVILAGLLLIALVAIFQFFPVALRTFSGNILMILGLPIL